MDAIKGRKDFAPETQVENTDGKKKDAIVEASDKAKKDAEEREDRARKDAQTAENRAMEAQIEEMQAKMGHLYKEPSFEDRNALSETRGRADSLYQALTGLPASQPLPGEAPIAYRKRMADGLRKFSPKFKEERLDSLSGPSFDVVETQIYQDAQAALKLPEFIPANELRSVTYQDHGREITEYVGDSQAAWAPFMGVGAKINIRKPARH